MEGVDRALFPIASLLATVALGGLIWRFMIQPVLLFFVQHVFLKTAFVLLSAFDGGD